MIVAIDGPAGAGKSTIAARVARHFNYQLIDTGALYRMITFLVREAGIELSNGREIADYAQKQRFEFEWRGDTNVFLCNGKEVGDEIRTEEMSLLTSQVATLPEVRQALSSIARKLGKQKSSLLEGRDIGSNVFPDAEVKIFLFAAVEVRAQRRVEQAAERGEFLNLEEVIESMKARDTRDAEREASPLVCPDDAYKIDCSTLSIDEVTEKICELIKNH